MCMEAVYDMKELAKFTKWCNVRKGENLRFKLRCKFVGFS